MAKRYRVVGVDRDSGFLFGPILEGEDEWGAVEKAEGMGIEVEWVFEVKDLMSPLDEPLKPMKRRSVASFLLTNRERILVTILRVVFYLGILLVGFYVFGNRWESENWEEVAMIQFVLVVGIVIVTMVSACIVEVVRNQGEYRSKVERETFRKSRQERGGRG